MRAAQLTEKLIKCIEAKLPVLIKGAPGIGKSDIVMQAAVATKHKLIINHPVVSDPTDFKGLPGLVDGRAEWLPFGDLRELIEANEPTVFFLDDLGQAPAVVQAACMQLILARRVNGHKVSPHVVFVAATNRRQDKAGVTSILEPVKSRFATIIELEPMVEDWIDWAFQNDVPAEVIGFMHFRPHLLWKPEPTQDIINHPSPRTWAFVGKLVKAGITDLETIQGAIGEGAALEFVGYMDVYDELPDLDDIIAEPEDAVVPESPAAQYAVCAGLAEKATKATAASIIAYAERLPSDFGVLLVRNTIRKAPKVQNSKAFVQWVQKNKSVLF